MSMIWCCAMGAMCQEKTSATVVDAMSPMVRGITSMVMAFVFVGGVVMPAECDLPGMSCSAGGGSWLVVVVGLVAVAWLVRRGWPL